MRPTDPFPTNFQAGKLQEVLDEQRAIYELTEWDKKERARICAEREARAAIRLTTAKGKDSKGKGKERDEGKGLRRVPEPKGYSKGRGDPEGLLYNFVPMFS